jgi:hypothetical protein
MYGMVNKAIRGLVLEQHGRDNWDLICRQANSPESFDSFSEYDDAVTYNLVGAASEILETPGEKILYIFGVYWVESVATKSYKEIMSVEVNNFYSFLLGLDKMHSGMRHIFPNYSPPSFRVKSEGDASLQLDYYSEREGLLPFVEGLLQGLATHFKVEIQVRHIPDDQHPTPCKRMLISYQPTI